ncbi:sodium- and chloride-dependent glycine transporter 2-like isoform X2 [Periplaneta americana]|uniref:sodium- and chloride-dependent glycine transporter 2-like isoform X2 n=1 Tax=Periplaneta americana TaxID=6978 RepID=UPI0037E98E4E
MKPTLWTSSAFLVPYIIMLFTMGLPIFFLELVVGQYSGLGPNKAFQRMAPIFHGLGYCALVVITLITIYYQVIIGWTIFYIFASFSSELGWSSCDHAFNTKDCYSDSANAKCVSMSDEKKPFTFVNRTCLPVDDVCAIRNLSVHDSLHCTNGNGTLTHINWILTRTLSSEEYYRDYALGINGASWEEWGVLHWENVLCLLLSWIILFLCLMKGVQSSGKAAYFTAFFPYCVLLALLIRGATLDGAYEGIMFYITPSWEKLTDPNVWGDAASQTFYALGIGCGSLVTLSSYSRFNNNCHRDAFFVSITNTVTAILAGFVVFSILGFLAKQLNVEVKDVVDTGPGLAFITYPEAVLRMPLPQLWAVLFFFMLFTLGIGSQFAGVEAVNTAIVDQWPWLRMHKHWVAAGTCTFCFLMALPMCCSGGVYLFTLMDWNTASWAILIIGLAEVILVAWVYGCQNFLDNIAEMSMPFSKFTRCYWSVSWMVLAPVSLLGVLIFTLYSFTPANFGSYIFPPWVDALGWLLGIASLVPLPTFALYRLVRGKEVGLELLQPTKQWGPASTGTISPTIGGNEDIEKPYNAFESVQRSAADRDDTLAITAQKTGPMPADSNDNKQADNSAYVNRGFQFDISIMHD